MLGFLPFYLLIYDPRSDHEINEILGYCFKDFYVGKVYFVKKEGDRYFSEVMNVDKCFDGEKIRKKPGLVGIEKRYFDLWLKGWIVIVEGEAYYNPGAFDLEGFIESVGKKRVESFGMKLFTPGDRGFSKIESILEKCKSDV